MTADQTLAPAGDIAERAARSAASMTAAVAAARAKYDQPAASTAVEETPVEPADYGDFLIAKVDFRRDYGFVVADEDVHPMLKPHQRDIVRWAVHGGRRAIFASFGLGKSVMQLEILRLITDRVGGSALIVAPLGVRQEFTRDAAMLGMTARFIRRPEEMDGSGLYLTNYESVRDGRLDPALFTAVSLDEASVLRSFGSKTYQTFLTLFDDVRYRFVATATPSPNRYKELIHYAGYLGVMDTGQALAQPLNAKVLTPGGWRPMGDLAVGDQVIAGDGTPTRILGVYPQGEKPINRVTFSDGSTTRCTGEHLWLTQTQYQRNAAAKFSRRNPGASTDNYWHLVDTETIAGSLRSSTGSKNHMIPTVGAVEFDGQDVAVDPWLLGLLLGDGCLRETSITLTTADPWIASRAEDTVAPLGLTVSKVVHERTDGQPNYDYVISGGKAGRAGRGHRTNALLNGLRRYELLGKRAWEKRIPTTYLLNDPKVRLGVLQGLMDADGTISRNEAARTPSLTTTSLGLAEDVVFIVQSLGGTARIRQVPATTPSGEPGRAKYLVSLMLPEALNPFALPRKAELVKAPERGGPRRYVVSVEPDGVEDAQCIAVEHPSRLYVTDDFVVTHNTRFFQRDSTKANNLTLYPHKEAEFWLWLNTWGVFLQKPSDLGYDDIGYDLPDLEVVYHEVDVDLSDTKVDRDGQGRLFRSAALGVTEAAREKRDSIAARIDTLMEIVNAHVRGEAEGIPAQLLRGEPGATPSPAAGTQPAELPGEPREVRGEEPALAGGEPRALQGADPQVRRGEPREGQRDEPALVPGEPRPGSRDDQAEQARAVRPDGGAVQGDAREPARALPDLRSGDGSASCGPLPRDRQGAGSALQALQLSHRPATGRSGDLGEGGRVPDQLVIWCDLNSEQEAIETALQRAGLSYSSVHGGLSVEESERRLAEWLDRRTYALIGKPVMLGQGMNLQQCNAAVFVGVSHKFNDFVQALHRIQRYGQQRTCITHIIHASSERDVVQKLQEKWTQHKELTANMSVVIREHGLNQASIAEALTRSIGVDRLEATGGGWLVANNDCVPETRSMDADSVDLIVTSIPFSNHYEYTPAVEDFGHTDDNDHFWSQMDYLTPEMLRVLRPGRIYACHVKDRILFGNVTGAGVPTVSPFHAEAIAHARKHGFDYMGMITVVTDVVRENNQTYRLGWSEQCKDGTKMGVGSPEYVLLFHKPQTDRARGYADVPVTKSKDTYTRARWQVDAHAFWRSSGERHLTPDELAALPGDQMSRLFTEQTLREVYDYEAHIQIGEDLEGRGALPATFMSLAPGSWHPEVWHDVNRMLTLNTEQSRRAQAMHVCPLQFDIVDRLITRYSNPGDLVFDPFGGLFTVPLRAMKLGRRGRAVELNPGYFLDGVKYLQAEDRSKDMPSLFDLAELEDGAA